MRINKTLVGRAIPPTLVACLCVAGNAFGGFVNGGFEDGTLNGWTVQQGFDEGASGLLSGHSGNVGNTDPLQNVVWGQQNYYSTAPAPVVVNKSGYSDPYVENIQSMFIGNDMVKINDIGGNCHVTQISQTGLINAGDMTGGATFADLYLNWVGVMENPGHPHLDDPCFIIDVIKNGTLFYEERHFSEEAGWTQVGATGVF